MAHKEPVSKVLEILDLVAEQHGVDQSELLADARSRIEERE